MCRSRLLPAALVAALAVLAVAPAAQAAPLLQSENVTLLAKLPEAAGAIGARFSPDGDTMYVTGASGLLVYDVTQPQSPRRLGALALPHFENEDVDTGRVGGRDVVVISNDPSFTGVGVIYVIDVTNPSAPSILSATPVEVPVVNGVAGTPGSSNGHITSCIQGCRYLWSTGSQEGLTVFDLSDPARPRHLGSFTVPGGGFTHDVTVDTSGIAWVAGEDGTFGYDVATLTDPLAPRVVFRTDDRVVNTGNSGPALDPGDANGSPLDFLHHNSLRTGRDVLAVTEEDYLRPGCNGQGSFQTWKVTGARNADGTQRLSLLDLWTTELNELQRGDGRSNPLGLPTTVNCSAHWFDEDRGIVAQGWYDQGVRFLDMRDPRDIKQVGYYVTAGTFWAAYYAPTDPAGEIVYALDTAGGIDVLRIDRTRSGKVVRAPVSDRMKQPTTARAHRAFGLACPLPA
jgi:hypothetical protein